MSRQTDWTPDGSTAVLLLGNYRPAVSLARSLKPLGYRVVVGLGGGEGGAQYSRFADESWDHPPLEDGREPFLAALCAFLHARADIRVVFPVAEPFVRLVAAERARLPADRIYAVPSPAIVERALDKVAAYAVARSVGVPVAPYALAHGPAELARRCEEVGYPVFLRPLDSTNRLGGRKGLIVASRDELARIVPRWPGPDTALLVQHRVNGTRHNLFFAARDGKLVRVLETRIARTDAPDQTGLAVDGETVAPSDDLVRFTERLAVALGYSGVGLAQYLVDREAGAVFFIELNPRVAGSHAIAEAAGLQLGYLSIVLAAPGAPEIPFVAGVPGLRYAWTYGDLRGLVAALHAGLPRRDALRWAWGMVRACLRADVHMTWWWSDPLPTLALFARTLPLADRVLGRPPSRSTALHPAPSAAPSASASASR